MLFRSLSKKCFDFHLGDAVTPTDCPSSVHNRCVIEGFGGAFVLSRCFLDFSVGIGDFVIELRLISF